MIDVRLGSKYLSATFYNQFAWHYITSYYHWMFALLFIRIFIKKTNFTYLFRPTNPAILEPIPRPYLTPVSQNSSYVLVDFGIWNEEETGGAENDILTDPRIEDYLHE